MILKNKVLVVGPLNKDGVGGRLEEMKVWVNALSSSGANVEVFTRFNSAPYFGDLPVWESTHVIFGKKKIEIRIFKKIILRIWGSHFLKFKRDKFFYSKPWYRFLSEYDKVILFITDTSSERIIFESNIPQEVFIRFTGTLKNFEKLIIDGNNLKGRPRNYIFHDKNLLQNFIPELPYFFIDQTAIQEEVLLNVAINSNCKTFAMIGLFMEVKQVEEVINTFSRFPDFNLLIFGKGELESSYRKLILEKKLSNVIIRGFFPAGKMHLMFNEFDCLIINSSEETGPMTGVEAMAAGKTIISSSVGAMPGRLSNDEFIIGPINSLEMILSRIRMQSKEEIVAERNRLRNRYINFYSNRAISMQIKETILENNV